MRLPIFNSNIRELSQLQTNWASLINPVLSAPILQGLMLKNVALTTGDTSINHLLGRTLQGWVITRKRAAASIYDKQDSNGMADKTLVLTSDADVTVDLWVF